jgi:hypothetical protein
MHLKLTNGVPEKYTLGQLRRDNPQTSFPKVIPDEILAGYDIFLYTRSVVPEYDSLTHNVIEGNFEKIRDTWSLPYVVTQLPQIRAEENVRAKRNRALRNTDWQFRSDMTPSQELIDYCKSLRDIPLQEGFPFSVVWPPIVV